MRQLIINDDIILRDDLNDKYNPVESNIIYDRHICINQVTVCCNKNRHETECISERIKEANKRKHK